MSDPVVPAKKSKKRKTEEAAQAASTAPETAAAVPAEGVKPKKRKKAAAEAEISTPKPVAEAISNSSTASDDTTVAEVFPARLLISDCCRSLEYTHTRLLVALQVAQAAQCVQVAPPADPLAVANFRLCAASKAKLAEKGIAALFPIQAQTLSHTLDGFDVVGRARCSLDMFCLLMDLASYATCALPAATSDC